MAALLFRRELILEVDGGRSGLDEGLGELERVQGASEPGLPVGDDRQHPVPVVIAFCPVDLIGPA